MKSAFHSGDLGDLILAMPICREIGEVRMYVATRPGTKEFTRERYETIKGLLEAQPYIESVVFGEIENPDYDFSTFRKGGMPWGKNIVDIQSDWVLKRTIPYKPWLTAGKDGASSGRVIVHRSPRYHNHAFSWGKVIEKLGDRALSICFPGEHEELEVAAGRKIERIQLRDYLHLAELLNGADLFIGNQSSPMAVATGLGIPTIQETCVWIPDCIYKGAPIQYVYNGEFEIEGEVLRSPTARMLRASECPPKGWIVKSSWGPTEFQGLIMRNVAKDLAKWDKLPMESAEEKVIADNTARVFRDCPTFFGHTDQNPGRIANYLQTLGITGSIGR